MSGVSALTNLIMIKLRSVCLSFVLSVAAVLAVVALSGCGRHGGGSGIHDNEIEALATRLDTMLTHTDEYMAARERNIARLRKAYGQATDVEHRYWLAADIFDEYGAYDSDSALAWVERCMKLSDAMGRPDLTTDMLLNKSYIYTATGLLDQARVAIESVDSAGLTPAQELKYCDRVVFLSNHLDQYLGVEHGNDMYSQRIDSLLQSVMNSVTPDNPAYGWLMGWRSLRTPDQARQAIPVMKAIVERDDTTTRKAAMHAWMLSKLYERTSDRRNRLKYLIVSAMDDVRSATREVASLEELASEMLELGDLERASRYANRANTLANEYKNRVRLGNIADLQNRALTAIQMRQERQAGFNRLSLVFMAVMLVLLCVAIVYTQRRNRLLRRKRVELNRANSELRERVGELQQMREQLHESNGRLSAAVDEAKASARELSAINDSKEEYITNVFALCSNYITKQEEFRTRIYTLLKDGRFDEALRAVMSPEMSYDDIRELHANFDSIVLRAYPEFVRDFNGLLRPDSQIVPKEEGSLNTALRIYALVRLGLSDSVRIARFLHCSVQTVYNTRQKTRALSDLPRDEFDERVRSLGKPVL